MPVSRHAMPRPRLLPLLLWLLAVSTAAAAAAAAPEGHEQAKPADKATVTAPGSQEARPQSAYGDSYECKPEGAVCARKRECCGGAHCLQHTCWMDPHSRPPCREGGDRCWDSEDCCGSLVCGVQPGGYYDDGHPVCHVKPAPTCSNAGQPCSSPATCCDIGGLPATCPTASGVCTGCLQGGEACTLASQCCPIQAQTPTCSPISGGTNGCCVGAGSTCQVQGVCCLIGTEALVCVGQKCCLPAQGTCGNAGQCCPINGQSASCLGSKCYLANGANCTDPSQCFSGICTSAGTCSESCFAGSTLVRVRELPTPVALRDVKTGQHVQCVDASDDMRTPTHLTWCEVHNWAHAKAATYQQTRLSFTRPSGEPGHLTLSPSHLVVKLTNPSLSLGRSEPRVDAFGSFDMVPARTIQPGHRVAVLTDAARFSAVAITAVESVQAEGMYIPALEKPFIVADGVVAPLWIDKPLRGLVEAPAGPDGVNKLALYHYLSAPAYFQRFEPVGTAGTASNMTSTGEWPGVTPRMLALQQRYDAGEAINFRVVQAWFMNARRAAARSAAAGVRPAATLDGMMTMLRSDATWVKQPAFT